MEKISSAPEGSGKFIPRYEGELRKHILRVPPIIRECSGIVIFGRRIKSIAFTTDLCIVRNMDADAVLAVYPFTPQQVISSALITASYSPVFCGVGGGTTGGDRVVMLARDAEALGAMAVVVNAPIQDDVVRQMRRVVDIPIVCTVLHEDANIAARLDAGAQILNVSAAARTPEVVARIRTRFPDVPIIATGGPTDESIQRTIDAGANAISYTPPTTNELFRELMDKYRGEDYR